MRIPIVDTDSVGIIQDLSPHDMPLPAWSSGRNVRMIDGRVEKISGHKQSFTPIIAPRFILPFQHSSGYWWLYAGDTKVGAYQSGVNVDVTRVAGNYNATNEFWSGGILNGVPVLNNGIDIPQQWAPGQANKLVNLVNWPIDWRCKNMKPFKNYLVALATSKGGTEQPYNVNWSHPAEPGTVPISWDIADATKDAGENTLADTSGYILNQLALGDLNIIYKEDSVHSMQYIGGISIFGFRRLFPDKVGLLMPNGLCSFSPPGKSEHHFVFTPNDIIVHDGRNVTSILEGRMRKWLYANLDSAFFSKTFVVNNLATKEIWICFPLVGSSVPNCALIWNYLNNTTTIRDLPSVSCAAIGQITEVVSGQTAASWDSDRGTWDSDTSTWGSSAYQPVVSRLLMGAETTKTFVMDIGTQFEDESYSSFVERIGLTVVGQDKMGKAIQDSEIVKLLTEVWLRIEGNAGTQINVFVGSQESRDEATMWDGPYPFIIGRDKKINPLISGKILSFRFECSADSVWRLHGYDINVMPAGAY